MNGVGTVHLVGAGPGAPDLLTRRGLERLRGADVVVYDRLIARELLDEAPRGAELIDVGKKSGHHPVPQRQIEELLVEKARAGHVVVRLKGGDPFVFGRGAEELDACHAAGIPCEVVPGLSSALAGPAAAGLPVTERGHARSFAVMTGHLEAADAEVALPTADTQIVLMGVERLAQVVEQLLAAGRAHATPAALIEKATWPDQRVVAAPLGEIVAAAAAREVEPPALLVVGPTAARAAGARIPPEGERPNGLAPSDSLRGRRVVLCRPHGAARHLEALLVARGAQVFSYPLITTQPRDPEQLARELPASFADFAWLVFTSRHGAAAFGAALRAAGRDARALASCRIAAIGPTTAAALGDAGLVVDLVPTPYRATALVEALVAQLRDRVSPVRIYFAAGSRARREVVEGLAGHGVTVHEHTVYDTHLLPPDPRLRAVLAKENPEAPALDAVLLASPSAAEAWAAGGLRTDLPAICLGPTTAEAARAAGFREVATAMAHHDRGLVAELITYLTQKEAT